MQKMAALAGSVLSFFLFYLLLLAISRVSSQALSMNEKQILLKIKQEWGDPAIDFWNDSSSSSYCSWHGVGCAADGSVSNISLSGYEITQPIPSSLCALSNLSHLNLSYNNIPGPFPAALFNCSALLYLDLSQNHFVGRIPPDIDRLSDRLTQLDLSSNNFTGSVPPAIGRFPALQVLKLNSNLFNGSFPSEIGNLSNLESLILAFNPFAPMRIPAEFGNLTKLSFLWMTATNLIGEMPPSFAKLTELVRLELAENSLTGSIPAFMWSLPKLQYFYSDNNNLSGSITIDGTIGALGLVEIDLSRNQLNGSIPEDFSKLDRLSFLSLYENRLTGEIPASIGRLPSLTDLRLFNNILSGVLPPELGQHSPLLNIDVCDNEISGEIPSGLCGRGALVGVVLYNNTMSGTIPPSLGRCSTLGNLQLHSNRFSGEMPDGIWSIGNLTTVILRDNALSGELPDKLPWNLTILDIQNNRFSGRVPSQAGNLVTFLAGNNEFSGDLPSRFAGLSKLQSLSLGGNTITGKISLDLSPLMTVAYLNLSHNQLTGSIPRSIGSLPVLNSLDLSSNELSGAIPTEMGMLTLSFLNLSSNQLSGEIPAKLESAAYSKSFLSNPSLCATNSLLNVATCSSNSSGSGGLAIGMRIFLMFLGAVVIALTVAFTARIYRGNSKRKSDSDDPADWKLTSFHSLEFTVSSILRGIKEENAIGSGGSGQVYRSALSGLTGEVVAVKKISTGRRLGSKLEKGFLAEVQILGSIRHKNIIKLLCCITSVDSKLLVYEYMENSSLDRWLHGNRKAAGEPLDWPTRLEIAIGSAQGLCYMHHECSPPIIHRDVKSSNILLDSKFNARIADFGLARMVARPSEADSVSVIAGSFGYMAPECGNSRRLNEKVDVYSFGVVLLELTTGRGANADDEQGNLAEWAWRQLRVGRELDEVVDPAIKDSPHKDDISTVFKLGLLCTSTLPPRRPSMKEVLQILQRCKRPSTAVSEPRAEHQETPLQTKRGRGQQSGSGEDGYDGCNV